MGFRPPIFLVTGFVWLILSSFLGIALFLGLVLGNPPPPWLRLVHVHSALAGGVAQIILGAMLSFIPPLLMTGRDRPESHPLLYVLINGGTVTLLIGFVWGPNTLIAGAGLLIILTFLNVLRDALRQVKSSLVSPPMNLWFYGIALLALLAGLGMGEVMALRLLPPAWLGQERLAHIHLNLLGFVTLTIVGTMHNLFPTVLNVPLHSPRLARWTFFILPAGILALIAGFLLGHLPLDLLAGAAILAGTGLYAYNITRTWMDAGRPTSAPADHLILATCFLLLAVGSGLLVTANSLWTMPMPFGKLHLIAYTHLALIGFVFLTIVGALSHLLPIILAVGRTKSHKKRGPYLAELIAIVERRQTLQLSALSLGTIGLALVASLVWQFSMGSALVRIATWISAGLLIVGLAMFTVRIVLLFISRPESD